MSEQTTIWPGPARKVQWQVTTEAATICGPRPENQDCFLLVNPGADATYMRGGRQEHHTIRNWTDGYMRAAIMDGMGGHADGGHLATLAAICLLEHPPSENLEQLRKTMLAVHDALLRESNGPGIGGCTLVLMDINLHRGQALVANVGDSRCYFARREQVFQVTRDSRVHEFAYRDGEIDKETYEASLKPSSRLAQAVGFGSVHCFSRQHEALDAGLRIDLPHELPLKLIQHADGQQIMLESGDVLTLVTDGALTPRILENPRQLWHSDDLAKMLSTMRPELKDNATVMTLKVGEAVKHRHSPER
jgi:serine/threonine protein phosphatase PrpC